jgi:hypothetical protein
VFSLACSLVRSGFRAMGEFFRLSDCFAFRVVHVAT